MDPRRFFKMLEYTFTGKVMPLETLRRKETSCASISSKNFVDPADKVADEAKRLENSPVHPGDSGLTY